MISSRITCPACKQAQDRKAFEQYKVSVVRTMGYTRPDLDVMVCPSCGNLFAQR